VPYALLTLQCWRFTQRQKICVWTRAEYVYSRFASLWLLPSDVLSRYQHPEDWERSC
jgi:hypothetical protein